MTRLLVFITPHMPHNEERLLTNLGNMLAGQVELHLCGHHKRLETLHPDVVQHVSNLKDMLSVGSMLRSLPYYLKATKEIRPDVVAALNVPTIRGFLAMVVARLTGTPYVMRLPGDKFRTWEDFRGLRRIKEYVQNNLVGAFVFRHAAASIALGQYLEQELLRVGVAPDRIRRISQPVDRVRFAPAQDRTRLRKELGLPADKKLALYAGRLTHEKGFDRMLDIIRETTARRTDLHYLVIGEGPYAEKLGGLSDATHIPSVHFSKIADYFRAVDLVLMTSRREGLPNVVLEATACRTPMIATPVGELGGLLPKTFVTTKEFIDFILHEDWQTALAPELSHEYDWDWQQKEYIALFKTFDTTD